MPIALWEAKKASVWKKNWFQVWLVNTENYFKVSLISNCYFDSNGVLAYK